MSVSQGSARTLETFLRWIGSATAKDLPVLRRDAEQWVLALEKASKADQAFDTGRSVGKGAYDKWVLELFQTTQTATPADTLLRGFAERFAEVHDIKPGRGPWMLVFSGYPPQGGGDWYFQLAAHAGLTPDQVKLYRDADLGSNRMLLHAFTPLSRAIDLWYLPYYRESMEAGLFDPLFGQRQMEGVALSGNAFVTAQALTDDSGRIAHAVFLLYPNKTDRYDVRQRPTGAAQDQRALDILVPVYRQLSAQNHSLAEDVERMKRDMVAQIGMALLNHEVGGMVNVLRARMADQRALAALVNERFDEVPAEISLLFRSMEVARGHADALVRTTDAFNNLDKRGSIHDFKLQTVFDQVDALTVVRCGTVGVLLVTEGGALQVHSDATLLLHALLNLVTNALNAIEESAVHVAKRVIRLRAGESPDSAEQVWIEVANSGPEIRPGFVAKLFQRGETTRAQGHGQGLYLVRRIAQYCGGDATWVPGQQPDEAVCFRMTLDRHLDAQSQLSILEPIRTTGRRA